MTLPLHDPRRAAFTALTHALLHELREDFRALTGREFPGGGGILFAHDFLIATAGERPLRWDDLDSLGLVVFAVERGAVRALPSILSDVACFTMFLADTDRLPRERADEAAEALRIVRGLAALRPRADGLRDAARRRSEAS